MQLREVGFHFINSLKSIALPWTRWGLCGPQTPCKKSRLRRSLLRLCPRFCIHRKLLLGTPQSATNYINKDTIYSKELNQNYL